MTRINVIDPSHLSNEHLLAENHEIMRPVTRVEKRLENPVVCEKRWKLGKGHELFFLDKMKFLHERYVQINKEMLRRGMSPSKEIVLRNLDRFKSLKGTWCYGSYTPDAEDYYWNMARLVKRSKFKTTQEELMEDYSPDTSLVDEPFQEKL